METREIAQAFVKGKTDRKDLEGEISDLLKHKMMAYREDIFELEQELKRLRMNLKKTAKEIDKLRNRTLWQRIMNK